LNHPFSSVADRTLNCMVVSDENAESVSVWQWNVAKVGELW